MKIAAREDKQTRNVRPLHHNVGEDLSCDIYHNFFITIVEVVKV